MRTELAEAQRRLSQGKTWYARLVEKNRQAEQAYEDKIERLAAEVDRLEVSK